MAAMYAPPARLCQMQTHDEIYWILIRSGSWLLQHSAICKPSNCFRATEGQVHGPLEGGWRFLLSEVQGFLVNKDTRL